MATDRRVVAKYFIFDNRLSTPNRVKEISLMVWNGVVTWWCCERLHFFVHPEIERCRCRIFFVPFLQVFITLFSRPAVDRVALWLRAWVLWFYRLRRVIYERRS